MKYDILDFIDSNAIKKHLSNLGHKFTPAEQAVLITHSHKTTVYEKLNALEYLYETYSNDEFGVEKISTFIDFSDVVFRDRVGEYIKRIKASVALRTSAKPINCIADICEKGHKYNGGRKRYFTSYNDAYGYINQVKNEYIRYYPDCICEYRIKVLNADMSDRDTHIYDNDLRFVRAEPLFTLYEFLEENEPVIDLSEFYVWVPLPFKLGDIVKVRQHSANSFIDIYLVITCLDPDDDRFIVPPNEERYRFLEGDSMYISLYYFEPNGEFLESSSFTYESISILDIDMCDESDIDKIDNATIHLAAALDDCCSYKLEDLQNDYSKGLLFKENSDFDSCDYIKKRIRDQMICLSLDAIPQV